MLAARSALLASLVVSTAVAVFGPQNVLIVVNQNSELSRKVGEYYARKRAIPAKNVCTIRTAPVETIDRKTYDTEVAAPVSACLKSRGLIEQALAIVTTAGVPLRIDGSNGLGGDKAAVDSELALLYADLKGRPHRLPGPAENPFFAQRDTPFSHPEFPMYMVTRLAGYDWTDIQSLIDRAQNAVNRGKVVIDMDGASEMPGNDWLSSAAIFLPQDRVVLDQSAKVLYDEKDVIAYASWGSNDPHRTRRMLGFQWLPGAIMTEYVSTNGRTFQRPPDNWNVGNDWKDRSKWFAGSPQSMTADYIHEGATGASGHVFEPYLQYTPRPDRLLPAYLSGRTLAESYYLSIPALSWQNIVVGDPLCRLAPAAKR